MVIAKNVVVIAEQLQDDVFSVRRSAQALVGRPSGNALVKMFTVRCDVNTASGRVIVR